MSRVYNTKRLKLFHGDAIEELKEIPDNRIDALITDPPAGIGFMGKDWDKDKGGRDKWIAEMAGIYRECLRVMKPGAHGLVWAIPRTSHWTATALEDAGFEVRDVIMHIFGTGFPKNVNISKAIDKTLGAERSKVKVPASQVRNPKSIKGGHGVDGGDRPWMQRALERGYHELDSNEPVSDEAKQWNGWGTALKPACEHWILVRKPISEKTVADNVLKYGTGVINVDGCRIPLDGETIHVPQSDPSKRGGVVGTDLGITGADKEKFQKAQQASVEKANELGRYPAHVILDEKSAEILDEQSGERSPGHFPKERKTNSFGFGFSGQEVDERITGKGGASRFFYVPKPSGAEKNAGLESKNDHPTVKPIAFMEYLCNLIVPPNGIVLDPFMGSGTTGIAALNKDFRFVGIEREEEYLEIAQARLLHALGEVAEAA